MVKIDQSVLDGAKYIEIPEADVRILCASPAEISKSLISKSLIRPIIKDGKPTMFETGPNIILLSDLHTQHNYFRNLIEFPLLQILYKQGLGIPSPDGKPKPKPMIVTGSYLKMLSQQEYFHTGNYGITDEEELVKLGLSASDAKNLVNMKRKFAFGSFKRLSDVVDVAFLNHHTYTPIKNGVSIRKININVYKIRYKNHSCVVDLNLKPHHSGEYNYHYEQSAVDLSDYFSVVHLGEGDGWNTDRPSMCSLVNFKGKLYLIDTPPNIEQTLKSIGVNINSIDGVLHTHLHDDHFAGLLSLIKTNRKLDYIASPLIIANSSKKMNALCFQNAINHFFNVKPIEIDKWNNIDGLEVKPMLSAHPVDTTCLFFRTLIPGTTKKYKTYAHLADIAPFSFFDAMKKETNPKMKADDAFMEKILSSYNAPASLKKIDVGEGMIHGLHQDFKSDESDIVRYSHLAQNGSMPQDDIIEIGHVDTLIKGDEDYMLLKVEQLIKEWFPVCSPSDIKKIMSTYSIKEPYSTIYNQHESVDTIYLVVSGEVGLRDDRRKQIVDVRIAGSLIGQDEVIQGRKTDFTYICNTFVDLVEISIDIVNKVYSMAYGFDIYHRERFLMQETKIAKYINHFDGLKLAMHMTEKHFSTSKIETSDLGRKFIYFIYSGSIKVCAFDFEITTLSQGQFLIHPDLSRAASLFTFDVAKNTTLLGIPIDIARKYPFIDFLIIDEMEFYKQKLYDFILEEQVTKELYFDTYLKAGHLSGAYVDIGYYLNVLGYVLEFFEEDSRSIFTCYSMLYDALNNFDNSFKKTHGFKDLKQFILNQTTLSVDIDECKKIFESLCDLVVVDLSEDNK